jgi:hypothetical protein
VRFYVLLMILRPWLFLAVVRLSFAGWKVSPAGAKPEFSLKAESVTGLSGLSWCQGDLYYAVSDRQKAVIPIRLTVDPATGLITAGKVEPAIPLKTEFRDFEDIACDAAANQVFISAEGPPGIAGFTASGKALPPVKLPPLFQTAVNNLSMESLTRDPATGKAWVANEDTLPGDGPLASRKVAGLVRLQEFDKAWRPLRQFAWRTETSSLRVGGSGSGVTGLCLLPGGTLLVMERVFSGLSLEVRLSVAGFEGANDTSRMPALAGIAFKPAQKLGIFKKNVGFTNYEGIAAGPVLKDGSRSLILVADSGDETTHSFLALRLARTAPK